MSLAEQYVKFIVNENMKNFDEILQCHPYGTVCFKCNNNIANCTNNPYIYTEKQLAKLEKVLTKFMGQK